MEIVKIDKRGRISLNKFIAFKPEYFMINETYKGQLLLTPVYDHESIKMAQQFLEKIDKTA